MTAPEVNTHLTDSLHDRAVLCALPPNLVDAAGRIRDLNAAWRLVEASALVGDVERLKQFVSEAQHAADMASQACEDWWLGVQIDELTDQMQRVRGAKHAYDMAVIEARNEDPEGF